MKRLSTILDLRRLERENRKYLYLGGFLGVIILGSILTLTPYEFAPWKKTDTYKRIVLRLVEVPPEEQPKLEKPAKMSTYSDIDEPLKRILEKSPSTRSSSDFRYHDSLPSVVIETDQSNRTEDLIGSELYGEERELTKPYSDVPFSKDIIRDEGIHHFNVMVSPTEKKAVEGYVRLALGWGDHVRPQEQMGVESLRNLSKAVNEHTNISAKIDKRVPLTRVTKNTYPFLYVVTGRNLELTEDEKKAICSYVLSGGFLFLDFRRTRHGNDTEPQATLMPILDPDPRGSTGIVIRLISSTHQLFHCFYDLKIPESYHGETRLYGIFQKARLYGIIRMSSPDDNNTYFVEDFDRRLGVNALIYALTPGNWYDLNRRMAYHNIATGEYIEWYENGRMRFRGRTGTSPTGYIPWLPDGAIKCGRLALLHPPDAVHIPEKKENPVLASMLRSPYATGGIHSPIPQGILDQMKDEIAKLDLEASRHEKQIDSPEIPPQTEEAKWKLIPGKYLFIHNGRISFLSENKKLLIPFQGVNNHSQHLVMWGDFRTYEGWYENGDPMYEYNLSDSTFVEWNGTGKVIASDLSKSLF